MVTCDANEYKTVIIFIILISATTTTFSGLKLIQLVKMAAKRTDANWFTATTLFRNLEGI